MHNLYRESHRNSLERYDFHPASRKLRGPTAVIAIYAYNQDTSCGFDTAPTKPLLQVMSLEPRPCPYIVLDILISVFGDGSVIPILCIQSYKPYGLRFGCYLHQSLWSRPCFVTALFGYIYIPGT